MHYKNKLITITLLTNALFSISAHADWLGALKDATDVVKRTGILDKASTQSTGTFPSAGASKQSNNGTTTLNDEMPMGLAIYPEAELKWRVDNPFDQVNMPISIPRRAPSGKSAVTSVPTEGKVTMLSFVHQDNDSPLLIQKHYESWLASNGFERMMVCQSPCKGAGESTDWRNFVDPLQKMDSNYIPKKATVIAAYKNNAMAVVMVGQYLFAYSSFVKVVDGQVIDNTNWKKLMTPGRPLPVVEPSKPAPVVQVNAAPSLYAQQILPNELLKNVESSKGPVIVHLSSLDNGCGYCVKSNPNFDTVAKRYKGKAIKFWQSGAQPWPDSTANEFAIKYQISSIPTTMLFQDGKLVERVMGLTSADELERKLITVTNALGQTAVAPAAPVASPTPQTQVDGVQAISGNDALARIRNSKGVVFVQISSYDKHCNGCANANASFDGLATRYAGKGEFWQVTAQPWGDSLKNDFARSYGISAVPATLVFKDGQIAKSIVYGAATLDELDNKLVK